MHFNMLKLCKNSAFSLFLVGLFSTAALAAVTDVYKPFCSSYANPPPGGWKRWSAASTWPGGIIPGMNGNTNMDAVIPCNTGVILDKSVKLDKIIVNGWLRVVDPGPFQVTANFVIIQGRLTIGTAATPYTGKITFNLTDGGYEYSWTRSEGSNTVGTKAFAVIGGLVEMNGMYGNQKAWTTLTKTAVKGTTSLEVKGDVSQWPVGATIAIASTDFDRGQAESRTLTAVVKGTGVTTLTLSQPLSYMHWGKPIATGLPGVTMSQSAEVALLDRSIKIQGSVDPADPLIGGHFIVFQTSLPQKIIGVELVNMGQQGTLGRYPMHFHLCQDVKGAYVKSLSVHHTHQRCVVVHGTWNHLIDGCAAYATKGHCYFLEDGIEYGNTFSNNLGFVTEPPLRTISNGGGAVQSDGNPATFWISNPNNSWINNVAGGAANAGYWFELAENVLGPSALFPNAKYVHPHFTAIGRFEGNVAHSNSRTGLATYTSGYRPRQNGAKYITEAYTSYGADVIVKDFRSFKNGISGAFVHQTDSFIIDGGFFADNRVEAIELHIDEHCIVKNAVILGNTENVGNPTNCQVGYTYGNCQPLDGCSLPVDPANARSFGSGLTTVDFPQFGILIDQNYYPSYGLTDSTNENRPPRPHHIYNVTFGKFDNRCRTSAAITINGKNNLPYIGASHSSRGLKFVDDSPRIYMAPRALGILGNEGRGDAGPTATSYVFRDEDGSLIGGPGGYVVTNTLAMLPFGSRACRAMNSSYGWACPNTCYRTVGFSLGGISGTPVFTVTRVLDNSTFTQAGYATTFLNLPSGLTYRVTIDPMPSSLKMWFGDPEGCLGTIIVQLAASDGNKWDAGSSNWLSCAGSTNDGSKLMQVSSACFSGAKSILQVVMGGKSKSSLFLSLVPGTLSCTSIQCGILAEGSSWLYNDMGAKLASPDWSAAAASTAGWKENSALFGYGAPVKTVINSVSQMSGVAWYFKTSFNFRWVNCLEKLKIGVIVNDGVVIYLNGKEVYRNKMPAGAVTASTLATGGGGGWGTPDFTVAYLDINSVGLITGKNTLAVEVHASATWSWNIRFDMFVGATGGTCASSTMFSTNGLPTNTLPNLNTRA